MKPARCDRGQGMAEALLVMPLLIIAFTALLSLGYRGLLFYMTDYQLHEALVCLDDDSVLNCQQELENKIKPLLFFKTSFHSSLSKTAALGKGSVQIQLKPLMHISKEMRFPLNRSL